MLTFLFWALNTSGGFILFLTNCPPQPSQPIAPLFLSPQFHLFLTFVNNIFLTLFGHCILLKYFPISHSFYWQKSMSRLFCTLFTTQSLINSYHYAQLVPLNVIHHLLLAKCIGLFSSFILLNLSAAWEFITHYLLKKILFSPVTFWSSSKLQRSFFYSSLLPFSLSH